MGVLATLVPSAQPALYGGGVKSSGTAGATWRYRFQVSSNGTAVNLSSVTTVCYLVSKAGAQVATFTASGDSTGLLTIEMDEALTASIAVGAYSWYAQMSDASDVVWLWDQNNSSFRVVKGA